MASRGYARSYHGGQRSWLRTLLVWVVLPLVLVYTVILWRVNVAVDRLFDAMGSFAQVDHGRAFVHLNGDVGVKSVYIRGDSEKHRPSIHASSITLHTPGIGWVLRVGLLGARELPDRFGVSADDIELGLEEGLVTTDAPVGAYTAALFDAAGCVDHALTRAELREFGYDIVRADVHLDYALGAGDEVVFTWSQDVEGVARARFVGHIGVAGDPRANPAAWLAATLKRFELTLVDDGFAAKRLSTCANRLKLSPDAFLDRHLAAAQAVLRSHGIALSDGDWAQYRQYATTGGSYVITAIAARPVPIATLAGAESGAQVLDDYALQLRDGANSPRRLAVIAVPRVPLAGTGPALTIEQQIEAEDRAARENAARIRNGEGPRPVAGDGTVSATPPPAGVVGTDPALPAADGAKAAIPAAAVKPASPPKPGDFVPVAFADLGAHLGQPIRIETVHGTIREGILEQHSRFGVQVRLDARVGGILLSVAANEVRRASVATPAAPATSASRPRT